MVSGRGTVTMNKNVLKRGIWDRGYLYCKSIKTGQDR